MRKRIISLILALSVMFSCLPVQAFAGNDIILPDIAVEESLPDDSANGLPSDIGNTQEIPRPAEQPEATPERTEEPEVTDTPAEDGIDEEQPQPSIQPEAAPERTEEPDMTDTPAEGGIDEEQPQLSTQPEATEPLEENGENGIMLMSDEPLPIEQQAEDAGLGGGKGTENDPYIINTYSQLLWFANKVNSGTTYNGKYVALGSNIEANNTGNFKNWSISSKPANVFPAINGFEGTFDGNFKTISGLFICYGSSYSLYIGFFGKISSKTPVTIKNVHFSNCYVTAEDSYVNTGIGGIVGYAASLHMENCTFSGKVIGMERSTYVGGIIGHMSNSDLNSRKDVVGVLKNCINYAEVSGGGDRNNKGLGGVGGIGGYVLIGSDKYTKEGLVVDCINYGNVTSGSPYTGGVFGKFSYYFGVNNNSTNQVVQRLGNYGKLESTRTEGDAYIGGVLGTLLSGQLSPLKVTQLFNYGDITGNRTIGGILGCCEYSYSSPSIEFFDLYNVGDITSTNSGYAGGIIGQIYESTVVASLKKSINIGKVTSSNGYALYAKNASGTAKLSVAGCYYLSGCANKVNASNAYTVYARSADDMKNKDKFSGLNFDKVWKMNTAHPVFIWQDTDVVTTISNNDIIKRVGEYTSTDLFAAYERIMASDVYRTPEQKNRALTKLFRDNGLSDVNEGVKYISSRNEKHKDYLALTTNENFVASIYTDWLLNTLKGNAFRLLVLTPASLAYNNEINDWLSFPTYAESEYPGVKKYKAMLYDLLDVAAEEIEIQGYIKAVSDIAANTTGSVKGEVEGLIDVLNTTTSAQERHDILLNSTLWEKVGRHSANEILKINDDGEEVFTYAFRENSGLGRYAKLFSISGTVVNVVDTSLSYFIDMNMLNARLEAYVQFESFLRELSQNTHLPFQMRWAAAQIIDEMETGYSANTLDFVIEIFAAGSLNDEVFDAIFEKMGLQPTSIRSYLITINITSFFVNGLTNIGETMQNVAFVEGYSRLADWYSDKLKEAAAKFNTAPDEDHAWDFVSIYNMLHLLRTKGEEAYVDLLDVDGILEKLPEYHYKEYDAVAKKSLENLKKDLPFDLTGVASVHTSVQYTAKMIVSCPVDVDVYSSDGTHITTLKDGVESDVTNAHGRFVVQYDMFTDEYEKILCFSSDRDYKIKITAVDKGLVNLAVTVKDGSSTVEYEFNNVKIEKDTTFTTTVEQLKADQNYDIDEDGDGINDSTGTVEKNPATHTDATAVKIDSEAVTVCLDTSIVLGVDFTPADTTNKTVRWLSSDESVATVKYGKLSALKEGTATVTAFYGADAEGEDISGSCQVTVVDHNMQNGSCTGCGKACENHTGGTATCTEKAKCTICGLLYGDINRTNHTGEAKWTQTAEKHSKAYECCGADLIPEEAHHWAEGKCEECDYDCVHTDFDTDYSCDYCREAVEVAPTPTSTPTPNPQGSTKPAVHTHRWNLTLQKNATHHWYSCYDCDTKDEYVVHSYSSNGYCEKCGYRMTEEPTEKGESPSDSADTTENIEQSKDLTVQPESTAKPGDIPSTEVSQDDGAVFGVIGIVAAAAVFILLIIILKRRKDEE